jgi:hypothetical protein
MPPRIVKRAGEATSIYWLGITFTKSKGDKHRFCVKIQATKCAPEMLAMDAFVYLVNGTAASCITPLVSSTILKVRFSNLKKAAIGTLTPAPSIDPTQRSCSFARDSDVPKKGAWPHVRIGDSRCPLNSITMSVRVQ